MSARLTPGEQRVLAVLEAAGGRFVSAEDLAREALCFAQVGAQEKDLVRQYVYRLRRLLGREVILSDHGRGYAVLPARGERETG